MCVLKIDFFAIFGCISRAVQASRILKKLSDSSSKGGHLRFLKVFLGQRLRELLQISPKLLPLIFFTLYLQNTAFVKFRTHAKTISLGGATNSTIKIGGSNFSVGPAMGGIGWMAQKPSLN